MKVLVTGAAGFIGCHAVRAFLSDGAVVVGLDNLSRRGAAENLRWLGQQRAPGELRFCHADVRSQSDMERVFAAHGDAQAVLHLAGQVAVTTSVADPRADFEANALGTLNVLEAVRRFCPRAAVLYASTNKVYGGMEQIAVEQRGNRYAYRDLAAGMPETAPLDFHSPYGCSKGAGDQYVRDYARIYGLQTVVLRQSCVYGTRQFGIEDQGWVAWFCIASILGKPITLYGDGKQVRDVLWVDDLVDLYRRVIERIDVARGQVYNAGGGPQNALSLCELLDLLSRHGRPVRPRSAPWRPGDQKVFIADVSKARADLGWAPRTAPSQGVARLLDWTETSRALLESVLNAP